MNSVKKIQIEKQKQKAIKSIMVGNYEDALPILKSLVITGKSTNDVEVLTALAHCYSAFNCPEESLFYLDVALNIDPDYLHAKFLKGCVLGDIGEYQDGIELVKNVIKNGLSNFETYGNLGLLYQNNENYTSAITAYKKALAFSDIVNPKKLENNLANCYSELGQFPEAIKIYDKLIGDDSKDTHAIYNKAVASEKMGNSPQSLKLLNQVVAIDPDFSKAWSELADLYDNIEAKDKATECRAKVEEIKSRNETNGNNKLN